MLLIGPEQIGLLGAIVGSLKFTNANATTDATVSVLVVRTATAPGRHKACPHLIFRENNSMDNDSTQLELSAEDISLGRENERTVIIESANPVYDGKAVRIRTLRGRSFGRSLPKST